MYNICKWLEIEDVAALMATCHTFYKRFKLIIVRLFEANGVDGKNISDKKKKDLIKISTVVSTMNNFELMLVLDTDSHFFKLLIQLCFHGLYMDESCYNADDMVLTCTISQDDRLELTINIKQCAYITITTQTKNCLFVNKRKMKEEIYPFAMSIVDDKSMEICKESCKSLAVFGTFIEKANLSKGLGSFDDPDRHIFKVIDTNGREIFSHLSYMWGDSCEVSTYKTLRSLINEKKPVGYIDLGCILEWFSRACVTRETFVYKETCVSIGLICDNNKQFLCLYDYVFQDELNTDRHKFIMPVMWFKNNFKSYDKAIETQERYQHPSISLSQYLREYLHKYGQINVPIAITRRRHLPWRTRYRTNGWIPRNNILRRN